MKTSIQDRFGGRKVRSKKEEGPSTSSSSTCGKPTAAIFKPRSFERRFKRFQRSHSEPLCEIKENSVWEVGTVFVEVITLESFSNSRQSNGDYSIKPNLSRKNFFNHKLLKIYVLYVNSLCRYTYVLAKSTFCLNLILMKKFQSVEINLHRMKTSVHAFKPK